MKNLQVFRNLWSFPKGAIKIIVADCLRNDRLQYRRTGPGDMKTLMIIRDSLEVLGHNNVSSHFADLIKPEKYENDNLILIGGYKNNIVTKRALESIRKMPLEYVLPYSNESIPFINPLEKFSRENFTIDDHFVSCDEGIILKVNSPFDRTKTLFVLFGITNFGTAACGTILDNETIVKKVIEAFSDGPFWLSFRVTPINQSVADSRIEIIGPQLFKGMNIEDLLEKSNKVRNVCRLFNNMQKEKETHISGTGATIDYLPASLAGKKIRYLSDILNLYLLDKDAKQIAEELGENEVDVDKDLDVLLNTFDQINSSSKLLSSLGVFHKFKIRLPESTH